MQLIVNVVRILNRRFDSIASKQAMESCERIISEMGAEIHDDLVQRLSILKLRIDRIQLEHGNGKGQLNEDLSQLQYDFRAITDSVRRISKNLNLTKNDGDTFEHTIKTLCQNIDGQGSTRLSVEVIGTPRPLPSHPEMYLIRMIQELIHNALKHSAAWHLWVRLIWQVDTLIIEVEDDGTGFARIDEFISLLKNKNNTLRMRAAAIGAQIKYTRGKAGLLAIVTFRV